MIDCEELVYAGATENPNANLCPPDGKNPGACAVSIGAGSQGRAYISTLAGERWKASMTRARIPAPDAATLILRAAWYTPCHLWARPSVSPRIASKSVDCNA
jgi:hypothetical protein